MKTIFTVVFLLILNLGMGWAQCYPDRHSTNWFDGWVSCEAFPNPNPARGMSHWIMYDFGQTYSLNKTHVWNSNDPANLDRGMRNVNLDYSIDGAHWTEAGTFIFDQADGSTIYQGFEGPDLSGIKARYVLITAVDNYGGPCYGLSEIRFHAEEAATTDIQDLTSHEDCFSVEAYPNPFVTKSRLIVQSQCEKEINYRITDLFGRTISFGVIGKFSGFHSMEIDGKNLPAGNYIVSIDQNGQFVQQHLIKVE